jgi:hypothetical protein
MPLIVNGSMNCPRTKNQDGDIPRNELGHSEFKLPSTIPNSTVITTHSDNFMLS